jgi:hypothetical protein
MHGSRWIDPALPAELIRVCDPVDGIVVDRDRLACDELCVIDGMPTTTPARTAYDIGRRDTLTQAVVRLDALAAATGLTGDDVAPLVMRHQGARGIVQLRDALGLMDGGAESPQKVARASCSFAEAFRGRRHRFASPISSVGRSPDSTWAGGVEGSGRIRRCASLAGP